MLKRNERGKLSFNHLDMQVFFDNLYEKCETEEEVEWLEDQIQSYAERGAEEAIGNL
jgi:uncharacterized protein YutD